FKGDGRRHYFIWYNTQDQYRILFSNGDGTCLASIRHDTGAGSRPAAAAVADLDRDGLPDIVVACQGTSVYEVFHGDCAPDTEITSPAPGSKTGPNVPVSFDVTKPGGTSKCQIDGGSFTPCVSPKEYDGLSDGSHTVNVRATDT